MSTKTIERPGVTTKVNVETTVDALGKVLAKIADLEKIEKELKSTLKLLGDGAYEGELFRATISTGDVECLNKDAMLEKLKALKVSHQWFTANTDHSTKTVVKVVARNGIKVVA